MDAFYASIEMRDNPALRGRPVVVGGSPNSRGVVCTGNYEARKFGVHSAMACSRAAKLCPQAVFLPPRFEVYTEVSRQLREIFRAYTPLVEPMSLDEAYLDVTDNSLGLYAVQIAKRIKDDVLKATRLTCSAGVAPNKLLAKIASDMKKPNGLTIVLPAAAAAFMRDLPVRKIPGVGPVTEKRLAEHGIQFCRDILGQSQERLEDMLGSFGPWLLDAALGIDESPVDATFVRKSLGKEETFPTDISDLAVLHRHIDELSADVAESLQERDIKGRTVVLKVKYDDFTQITRCSSQALPINDVMSIAAVAKSLLLKTEAGRRKVRLLGVTVSKLEGDTTEVWE